MSKAKRLSVLELKRVHRLVEQEFLLRGSSAWKGAENSGIELYEKHIPDNKQCATAVKKFLKKVSSEKLTWYVVVHTFYEYMGKEIHEADEFVFPDLTTKEFDIHINDAIHAAVKESEFTMDEWRGYSWYCRLVPTDWEQAEETLVEYAKSRGVFNQTLRRLLVEDYHTEKAAKLRAEQAALLERVKFS